jgi:8-oxo-dGTP pyrophosphatase MutT (NUDIX family)
MLTQFEIFERLDKAYKTENKPESPYPESLLNTEPTSAAVLIPIFKQENDWHLLFIRRTVTSQDRHSGQVAFPGGRCDPEDTDEKGAALREAKEEVGIDSKDVQILGRTRELLTITNFYISPFVGMIPWPYKFTPQKNEVDRIFSIPLSWLADNRNRKVHQQKVNKNSTNIPVIYFDEFDGEILWGASARITLILLEALGLADPKQRYC